MTGVLGPLSCAWLETRIVASRDDRRRKPHSKHFIAPTGGWSSCLRMGDVEIGKRRLRQTTTTGRAVRALVEANRPPFELEVRAVPFEASEFVEDVSVCPDIFQNSPSADSSARSSLPNVGGSILARTTFHHGNARHRSDATSVEAGPQPTSQSPQEPDPVSRIPS